MWPRTSWSLSSFTRNIVFGRASVISPSISIFSSLPMRSERVARSLATPEGRLAGPLTEERVDRPLEILGAEQRPGDLRCLAVGLVDAPLELGADEPLRRRVREGRAGGQTVGESHPLLQQVAVVHHPVDDVPALER